MRRLYKQRKEAYIASMNTQGNIRDCNYGDRSGRALLLDYMNKISEIGLL